MLIFPMAQRPCLQTRQEYWGIKHRTDEEAVCPCHVLPVPGRISDVHALLVHKVPKESRLPPRTGTSRYGLVGTADGRGYGDSLPILLWRCGGGEVPFSFLLSCWLSRLLVDHLSNAHVRRRRFTAQVSYKAERRGKQRTGRSVVWMVSLCCWEGEGRGQWAEREEVAGSSAVLGTYAFKGRVFWLLEGQIPKEGILRPPSCNSVTLPLPHIIPAPT